MEKTNAFFKQPTRPAPSLVLADDLALDIADINFIQFSDKEHTIQVGFKSNQERIFKYENGAEYRRVKHKIMAFLDRL